MAPITICLAIRTVRVNLSKPPKKHRLAKYSNIFTPIVGRYEAVRY